MVRGNYQRISMLKSNPHCQLKISNCACTPDQREQYYHILQVRYSISQKTNTVLPCSCISPGTRSSTTASRSLACGARPAAATATDGATAVRPANNPRVPCADKRTGARRDVSPGILCARRVHEEDPGVISLAIYLGRSW